MGRNTIRYIIILATFSVLGIILIQFFFLKNTVDLNEKKFHESTTQALNGVAHKLAIYNQKLTGREKKPNLPNAVDQISNNYYVGSHLCKVSSSYDINFTSDLLDQNILSDQNEQTGV